MAQHIKEINPGKKYDPKPCCWKNHISPVPGSIWKFDGKAKNVSIRGWQRILPAI